MEYEKTFKFVTIDRFYNKKELELRKKFLELTIDENSPINLYKELGHVYKKLNEKYEYESVRLERHIKTLELTREKESLKDLYLKLIQMDKQMEVLSESEKRIHKIIQEKKAK